MRSSLKFLRQMKQPPSSEERRGSPVALESTALAELLPLPELMLLLLLPASKPFSVPLIPCPEPDASTSVGFDPCSKCGTDILDTNKSIWRTTIVRRWTNPKLLACEVQAFLSPFAARYCIRRFLACFPRGLLRAFEIAVSGRSCPLCVNEAIKRRWAIVEGSQIHFRLKKLQDVSTFEPCTGVRSLYDKRQTLNPSVEQTAKTTQVQLAKIYSVRTQSVRK